MAYAVTVVRENLQPLALAVLTVFLMMIWRFLVDLLITAVGLAAIVALSRSSFMDRHLQRVIDAILAEFSRFFALFCVPEDTPSVSPSSLFSSAAVATANDPCPRYKAAERSGADALKALLAKSAGERKALEDEISALKAQRPPPAPVPVVVPEPCSCGGVDVGALRREISRLQEDQEAIMASADEEVRCLRAGLAAAKSRAAKPPVRFAPTPKEDADLARLREQLVAADRRIMELCRSASSSEVEGLRSAGRALEAQLAEKDAIIAARDEQIRGVAAELHKETYMHQHWEAETHKACHVINNLRDPEIAHLKGLLEQSSQTTVPRSQLDHALAEIRRLKESPAPPAPSIISVTEHQGLINQVQQLQTENKKLRSHADQLMSQPESPERAYLQSQFNALQLEVMVKKEGLKEVESKIQAQSAQLGSLQQQTQQQRERLEREASQHPKSNTKVVRKSPNDGFLRNTRLPASPMTPIRTIDPEHQSTDTLKGQLKLSKMNEESVREKLSAREIQVKDAEENLKQVSEEIQSKEEKMRSLDAELEAKNEMLSDTKASLEAKGIELLLAESHKDIAGAYKAELERLQGATGVGAAGKGKRAMEDYAEDEDPAQYADGQGRGKKGRREQL